MLRFIQPQARDRWRVGSVANYTPDRVEQVLRGAFGGDLTSQWELFDLMEDTSPRIQKNLNELKQALQDHEWNIQPAARKGTEPSAEATRRAMLLEEAIWHCTPDPTLDENDFEDTLRDLADAWGKGISVQELHWAPRQTDVGPLIGLRATTWVHPRYYGYPPATTGPDRLMLKVSELAATPGTEVRLLNSEGNWAPFPPDKFLIGIAKQKTGHPIGGAMLRTLAWWWAAANFTGEWLLNLAQIFGVPIRWATYAQGTGKEQIDLIEEMLENMGSAAWAAFPAGTTLELKEAVKSGQDNPQKLFLDLFDKIVDLLILGQTLTSDTGNSGAGGGSLALGKVHAGVLTDRKRALINWTVKLLNTQFIPAFCRLNFSDTRECPYFIGGGEEEEDAKTTADTFKVVLDAGAPIPKRHFYDKLGIPEPKDGDPVIEGRSAPAPGMFGGDPAALLQARGRHTVIQAKSAQEQLTDRVLEELTGVEPQWLGAVKPVFHRLIAAAKSGSVSDAEFVATLERAQREMPELFDRLDVEDLQSAMESAMGAAVVNGAVSGALKRKAVAA